MRTPVSSCMPGFDHECQMPCTMPLDPSARLCHGVRSPLLSTLPMPHTDTTLALPVPQPCSLKSLVAASSRQHSIKGAGYDMRVGYKGARRP